MKPTILVAALLTANPLHAQVAITELLNNPDGTDKGREWVELFNLTARPVALAGWVLGDEGTDAVALPDVTLAAGAYLVLVNGGIGGVDAATAKAIFETEWLDGSPSAGVIGVTGMALANGADELVLRDARGVEVWSLAWADDETPPFATFLTGTHDFSIKAFGTARAPGVVRNGDDNGIKGFLGYEQNDATADRWATMSDVSKLAARFGEDFLNVESPSVGSPLAGGYRAAPVGDVDGDGVVGPADLAFLLAAWGPCPDPPDTCPADLDGDGFAGITDFLILIGHWG